MRTCNNCGRELSDDHFELYPTGTRRHVCRHCHYLLHTRPGRERWVQRQRARAIIGIR